MRVSFHNHSRFSFDSNASMRDIIETAIECNVSMFGFTEHQDFDKELEEYLYLKYEDYSSEFKRLKKEFLDNIELFKGIEIDYQRRFDSEIKKYLLKKKFDYKIGSVHYLNGEAVDLPSFANNQNIIEKLFNNYLDEVLSMVENIDIDILGHIDLVKLYRIKEYQKFDLNKVKSKLIKIFNIMKKKDIILEYNVSGFRKGLFEAYPSEKILKQYYENGNRLITWGEDAHAPEQFGLNFDKIKILKKIGFKYLFLPNKSRDNFLI